MEREEKVFFIIEQIRLCLAKKDFIRAEIISKKISTKFFFADTDNIQVYIYICTCLVWPLTFTCIYIHVLFMILVYVVYIHVYQCISVFSLGYKSSESQPHPLTTPSYCLHLNYVSCTIRQIITIQKWCTCTLSDTNISLYAPAL